jgi:hypothetical protein
MGPSRILLREDQVGWSVSRVSCERWWVVGWMVDVVAVSGGCGGGAWWWGWQPFHISCERWWVAIGGGGPLALVARGQGWEWWR